MNNYPDWLDNTINPQHLWKMQNSNNDDGRSSDNRPLGYVISGTVGYVSIVLCEDTSYSLKIDAESSTEIQDVADMNTTSLQIRQIGGWFRFSQDILCPTSIYKEGGGVNNVAILMGFGNVPEAQVADKDDFYVQEIRTKPLKPNKNYHLWVQFSGTNQNADLRFYINGRRVDKQLTRDPIEKSTLASHSGDVLWGQSDTNLYMGSSSVPFKTDQAQYYSCWLSESANLISDNDIWKMFEYGVIPIDTVTSQADVDNLANKTYEDEGCAIRVDVAGDIELTFDGITFDEWTSIHVQYTGTGTCTIYKANGCNLDSNRCTAPNGGTIVIKDKVTIKITVLDIDTKNPIQGARVYLKDEDNNVIFNDLTDSNGEVTALYEYVEDKDVSGHIRKASSSPYYKPQDVVGTITVNGFEATVLMVKDE